MNISRLALVGFVLFSSSLAFAKAAPITEDIALKSAPFARKVFEAMEKNVKPRQELKQGQSVLVIQIGDGLICSQHLVRGLPSDQDFSCVLLKSGGWKSFGMEAYGAGDNAKLVDALYDALNVSEEKEEAFTSKSVELDRPDGNGGTERNQLSCIRVNAEGQKLGVRSTCQIINAL